MTDNPFDVEKMMSGMFVHETSCAETVVTDKVLTFLEEQQEGYSAHGSATRARYYADAIRVIRGLRASNKNLDEQCNMLAKQLDGEIDKLNVPCANAIDELWKRVMPKDYGDWEYPGFAMRHLNAEFEDRSKYMGLLNQIAFNACMVVDIPQGDPMWLPAKSQLKSIVDQWRKEIGP